MLKFHHQLSTMASTYGENVGFYHSKQKHPTYIILNTNPKKRLMKNKFSYTFIKNHAKCKFFQNNTHSPQS